MSQPTVLHSRDEIARRVNELADKIGRDYEGRTLVLLGILKGSSFLLADLARALTIPASYEFVDVTTTVAERGEVVQLTYATNFDLSGADVLILKDVLHTGVTENYLLTHLSQQRPSSMEILTLIDRPHRRSVDLVARYAVFNDVPDGYLAGYGLGSERSTLANRPDLLLLESEE